MSLTLVGVRVVGSCSCEVPPGGSSLGGEE